ncbi:MAG: DUF3866 family protein, partial [Actinomycetota bacterium]
LLTASALARGLGTGGYAMVVAFPDALPSDPEPTPGHIVKARYTPLQYLTLGVDEQESTHHGAMAAADDVSGMPVVVADLHSALPAIVAGIRAVDPALRVAYVHTDGGALPAWFSRTAAALRDARWLAGTITAGQSFGGDHEAVTVHSALLAARHVVEADVAVVAQGPGNLGTGTPWGFTGVACGEALNAVAVLGGAPVAALRVSGADPRPRHRGISHHSLTAVGRVATARSTVVVPLFDGVALPEEAAPTAGLDDLIAEQLPLLRHHDLAYEPVDGLYEVLAELPVRLSTMGRGLAEDPAAFLAVAAAGRVAARRP